MIHEQGLKLQRLRNRWREGLQGQKIVLAEKNPIVFFGDLLAKRENDLYDIDFRISKLEVKHFIYRGNIYRLWQKSKSYSAKNKLLTIHSKVIFLLLRIQKRLIAKSQAKFALIFSYKYCNYRLIRSLINSSFFDDVY